MQLCKNSWLLVQLLLQPVLEVLAAVRPTPCLHRSSQGFLTRLLGKWMGNQFSSLLPNLTCILPWLV